MRILDTCGSQDSFMTPVQKTFALIGIFTSPGPPHVYEWDKWRYNTTTTEIRGDEKKIIFSTDSFFLIRFSEIIVQVEGDPEMLCVKKDRVIFHRGIDKYGFYTNPRNPDSSELERYLGLIKRASRRPNLRGGLKIRQLVFSPKTNFGI